MKTTPTRLAIALTLLSATLQGSTINLNFTPEANKGDILPDLPYGLIPVAGANWNQVTESRHTTNAHDTNTFSPPSPLNDGNSQPTPATVAINAYDFQNYGAYTAYDPLLRSSVRDNYGDTYPGSPRIKIEHIPYAKYDLFIYMTNDAADYPKNGPLGFDFGTATAPDFKLPADGLYYYMDGIETKTTTIQATAWGDKATQQPTLGKNCIRIPNCTAETFVMKGYRTYGRRANICALQIAESKTITLTGDATISAAEYAGASLQIVNTGSTLTTLTIEGPLTCASFICAGEPFTLKIGAPVTAAYAEIHTPLTLDISPYAPTLAATLATPQTIPILTAPLATQTAVTLAPAPLIDAHATASATGITALIRHSLPFAGARAISVNLGAENAWGQLPGNTGKTGNTGLYPVDATRWVNLALPGNTGGYPTAVISETITDNTGASLPGMTVKACSSGASYYSGANATLTERLFYRYLNDNNSDPNYPGTNYCGIAVTGIPYEKYALILYYNSNVTANNIFAAPQINGACYAGDAALGFTLPVSTPANYWGKADPTRILEGHNTLVVTGFNNTDNPETIVCIPSKIAGGKRTTISAFQIVEIPAETVSVHHTATLPGGDIAFTQIPWDSPAAFSPADTVTLSLLADTTLTLDHPSLTLSKLSIKGAARLRLLPGAAAPTIGDWYFNGLDTLEINADLPTYTPAPIAQHPATTLYTTATAQTITSHPGQTIELRAGTPAAPARYTLTYAGGAIRIPQGHYIYTAAGSTIHTTLQIGPDATLDHGAGKFSIGHMDALITGGAVKAEYLVAAQGENNNNSPSRITQTGGHITLTSPGSSAQNGQTFLLGNNTASPSQYTITGGSITATGLLHLSFLSAAYLTIEGGQIKVKGIIGTETIVKNLTLTGGELSIGADGISAIPNAHFTAAGGELTAHATSANGVSSPFNARPGTTSTLSAATGETLEFKAPILGSGGITIGNPAKDRTGTVAFSATEPAGPVTVAGGTLLINGSGAPEPRFTPVNYQYLRLTITGWPKTNPNANLTDVNTGIVITEFILKNNGQTVPWAAYRTAASVPEALANFSPDALYDGNYAHAYVCTATPADGKIVITINRNATSTFDSYQILAGQKNGRNPTAWILEGTSNKDTAPWVLIDTQNLNLNDIVAWTSAGGTTTEIGPGQARAFPHPPTSPATLTVTAGGTLGGTGATAHTIVFHAASTLLKTGAPAEALTALGAITLPETGKINIPAPADGTPGTKYYLLRGPAAEDLDLTRFTTADRFHLARDSEGIFLRRRDGSIITLH